MGLSMCGRFGDWVILVTGLSCGLGYPGDWVILVTGLSCGLGYPGDWVILVTGLYWDWVILVTGITSLIGEMGSSGGGEEVGDGDNIRYTCNLLEHE